MAFYFVTYADSVFENARRRLLLEAKSMNVFDHIIDMTPSDLPIGFKQKHQNMFNLGRGGYWIWKFFIIQTIMSKLDENDVLVYADAGCSFNLNGRNRLLEYFNMLEKSDYGLLTFQLPPHRIEKCYTSKKVLDYFEIMNDDIIANNGQIMATTVICKKNKHSTMVLEKLVNAPSYLYIPVDKKQESSYFIDHRHDQSVFSIICKIYGSIVIPDETFESPFGKGKSKEWPIWATRKRH